MQILPNERRMLRVLCRFEYRDFLKDNLCQFFLTDYSFYFFHGYLDNKFVS